MRELIYREILEYHPHMLADYMRGSHSQPSFMYPSAVDNFKRQFAQLEAAGGMRGPGMNHLGQARHPVWVRPVKSNLLALNPYACRQHRCHGKG